MLYAYYGSVLRIGRKEYKLALDMLLHAIRPNINIITVMPETACASW